MTWIVWAGAAAYALANLRYTADTARGLRHPSRVTWGVWAVTAGIALWAAWQAGAAPATLVTTGAAAAIPAAVVAASLVPWVRSNPPMDRYWYPGIGPPPLLPPEVLNATAVPARVVAELLAARWRQGYRAGLADARRPVAPRVESATRWQRWIDLGCLTAAAAIFTTGQLAADPTLTLVLIIATDGVAAGPTLIRAAQGKEAFIPYAGGAVSAVCTLLAAGGTTAAELAFPAYFLLLSLAVCAVVLTAHPIPGKASCPTPSYLPSTATVSALPMPPKTSSPDSICAPSWTRSPIR